jgi:asparagine synthase (glutamine-hydrolysing)
VTGLAGILRFDGGPVDPAALDAMAASIHHRGGEASGRWHRDPVGLVEEHRATTRASLGGRHPCVDEREALVVSLDGRIDNRSEVVAALGPTREGLRDHSDGELVLRAYQRWGRAAFARLVGDFAVVLWDADRRELVAARDPLGKRPLLYLRDRRPGIDALRWGSEVVAVLADPAIRRRPNPGMVAEHLVGAVTSATETVLDGVLRVPPAHALVATSDGRTTVERYWSWDRSAAVARSGDGSHDDEHVARFLEVFTTAVEARLDTAAGPVAAELSGGVDSSCVVATAAPLLAAAGRDPLEVFAITFPGTAADERPYQRDVAALVGVAVTEVEHRPLGPDHYEAETRRTLLPALPPNYAMHRAHLGLAAGRGARVVLSGQGGDEWFTGSPLALADDLRRLRLRGVLRRMADDRALWPARSPAHQLVRDGLLPLVGRAHRWQPPLEVLRPEFRAEVALEDRLARPGPRGPVRATAEVAAQLDDGGIAHGAEMADRSFGSLGLEARSPFDDRRLVELALALPDHLLRRGQATKWVVRVAMEGRVPDSVRYRGDKTSLRHVVEDELEACGGARSLEGLALAEAGWVDEPVLRRGYEDVLAGRREGRGSRFTWASWNSTCTDRWFRSILSP